MMPKLSHDGAFRLRTPIYFVSWNGCSNKADKRHILLVTEDFLFDISVSDARTQLQYQKTIKKTPSGPENTIFYMCRMTHFLDTGHPSFCLRSVIFTEDSMQIICMVG